MWGTTRSIINSAVIGVTTGHERILELNGVGFRANLKGNILNLQLGFSHDTSYTIPKEVKITLELYLAATSPILGLFFLSRSPPHPIIVKRFSFLVLILSIDDS